MIVGGSDVMLQLILFLALFSILEFNKLKSHQQICILKLVNSNMRSMLPTSNDENFLAFIFHVLNSVFCSLPHFII